MKFKYSRELRQKRLIGMPNVKRPCMRCGGESVDNQYVCNGCDAQVKPKWGDINSGFGLSYYYYRKLEALYGINESFENHFNTVIIPSLDNGEA